MSPHSVGSLKRISSTKLAGMILDEKDEVKPSFVVVDVRDDDYIGGHIKGSMNVPIMSLDGMMPTLVRQLHDKKKVVFHCALSQQRGPSAALKYLRERDQILADNKVGADAGEQKLVDQEVYVLDRGFVGWQESYGEDERLTEGYRKELWKDGYWA